MAGSVRNVTRTGTAITRAWRTGMRVYRLRNTINPACHLGPKGATVQGYSCRGRECHERFNPYTSCSAHPDGGWHQLIFQNRGGCSRMLSVQAELLPESI